METPIEPKESMTIAEFNELTKGILVNQWTIKEVADRLIPVQLDTSREPVDLIFICPNAHDKSATSLVQFVDCVQRIPLPPRKILSGLAYEENKIPYDDDYRKAVNQFHSKGGYKIAYATNRAVFLQLDGSGGEVKPFWLNALAIHKTMPMASLKTNPQPWIRLTTDTVIDGVSRHDSTSQALRSAFETWAMIYRDTHKFEKYYEHTNYFDFLEIEELPIDKSATFMIRILKKMKVADLPAQPGEFIQYHIELKAEEIIRKRNR